MQGFIHSELKEVNFFLGPQYRWEVFEGLEGGFRLAVYPSFRCASITGVRGHFSTSSAAKESKDLCAFLPESLEVLERREHGGEVSGR